VQFSYSLTPFFFFYYEWRDVLTTSFIGCGGKTCPHFSFVIVQIDDVLFIGINYLTCVNLSQLTCECLQGTRPIETNGAHNMTIKITIRAVDGFSQTRSFKTLAGARRYAVERVGDAPDLGTTYAVDLYGVVTLYAEGVSLQDLFYPKAPRRLATQEEQDAHDECVAEGFYVYPDLDPLIYRHRDCHCEDKQLVSVGCDCGHKPTPSRPLDDDEIPF